MKHSISNMSLHELTTERQRMDEAVMRLNGTRDETGLYQLQTCKALRFALDCMIDVRRKQAARIPLSEKVVRLSEFRARREAK